MGRLGNTVVKKWYRVYIFATCFPFEDYYRHSNIMENTIKNPEILSQQKSLPLLGKQAIDAKVMDSDQINNTDKFEDNIHMDSNEIEAASVGDQFS